MIKCKNCLKEFVKPKGYTKTFCSRSCSSVFNNKNHKSRYLKIAERLKAKRKTNTKKDVKVYGKRKKRFFAVSYCKDCNTALYRLNPSVRCQKCENIKRKADKNSKPIRNFGTTFRNKNIRKHARREMVTHGVEKKCNVCGYTIFVDTAHIKPVMSFDDHEKLSVVNHISNLIYLCPNHHKEFDHGIQKNRLDKVSESMLEWFKKRPGGQIW